MSDEQKRPETGVMRFGDDWPGVFIRGDNAVGFAVILEKVLGQASRGEKLAFYDLVELNALARQLYECDQSMGSNPQQLKSWVECVPRTYGECVHRGSTGPDAGSARFSTPCSFCEQQRGEASDVA